MSSFPLLKGILLSLAINLRNRLDLDNEIPLINLDDSDFTDLNENIYAERHAKIMDENLGDDYSVPDEDMTIEDYQTLIDEYEQTFGEKFFKENEGYF